MIKKYVELTSRGWGRGPWMPNSKLWEARMVNNSLAFCSNQRQNWFRLFFLTWNAPGGWIVRENTILTLTRTLTHTYTLHTHTYTHTYTCMFSIFRLCLDLFSKSTSLFYWVSYFLLEKGKKSAKAKDSIQLLKYRSWLSRSSAKFCFHIRFCMVGIFGKNKL